MTRAQPLELIGGADHELEAHAQRRMNVRDILAVGLSGRRDLEPILRGMRAQLGDEVLRESGHARGEEDARSASEWHDIMLTKAEEAEREASPAPPLQDVARQEERGVRERQPPRPPAPKVPEFPTGHSRLSRLRRREACLREGARGWCVGTPGAWAGRRGRFGEQLRTSTN